MIEQPWLASVLQGGSGALLMLLGAAVLLHRQRTAASLAFGLFALAFGTQFVVTNMANLLWQVQEIGGPWWVDALRLVFRVTAALALVAMGLLFPRAVATHERPLVVASIGGALLLALLWAHMWWSLAPDMVSALSLVSYAFLLAGLYGVLLLWALRAHRTAAAEAGFRRQLALTSGALLLYVGFVATAGGTATAESSILAAFPYNLTWLVASAALVPVVVLWLATSGHPDTGRVARNVALLAPAMALLGLLYVKLGLDVGALGILRTFSVAVLAYAILRHHLLGIDVTVRWGISKSTVAAVFIAVFFITSEAAQTYFGEELENSYLGIAAAGVLVFGIAPLQRLADRVAETALPLADAPPDRRGERTPQGTAGAVALSPVRGPGRRQAAVHADPPAADTTSASAASSATGHVAGAATGQGTHAGSRGPEAAYRAAIRAAIRAAMRDGRLTRREEAHLAEVAEHLGLGPRTAWALREAVEADPREAVPPPPAAGRGDAS